MDHLRAMRVFARVADEGSLAGAARALDLAPAVVTRLLAELEQHLGARLMNRTTRRLSLTEVGDGYLQRVRQILADVDEAEVLVGNAASEPRGHLRVLMPPAFAVHQLAKRMPAFRQQYPQVTIELHSPGPIEAIDESYDLTILSTRLSPDGDFIARRLARSEVILCASPEYLDRRGRPEHPSQLMDHDSLLPPISEVQRGITFVTGALGPDQQPLESVTLVPPQSVLSTSHIDTAYAAALHGLGVAGLPSFALEDALLEHALERVLPAWRLFSITLWAALPSRKHLPARTRALLDFLLRSFGGEDHDPWLAAAGCETQGWPCPPARARSGGDKPPALAEAAEAAAAAGLPAQVGTAAGR